MERTEHSAKRLKLSELSFDRLSGLPDAVLCHILSFLPTNESVATGILARRWRPLWTDVPTLYLDERHYASTKMGSSDIIHRIMLLQKVHKMITFRLVYKEECNKYLLETWIATAIARDVQNLDLYFYRVTELPPFFFTCGTLVDLRLHLCTCICKKGSVCLPSLKKLHLCSVKYGTDESLSHFLSSCTVLEDLLIDKIFNNDLVCCHISSPTLKRLEINYMFEDIGCNDVQSNTKRFEVKIDAPGLRYLKLSNCLSMKVSAAKLSSLIEADICFGVPIRSLLDSWGHRSVRAMSVIHFVHELYNVKRLKFSADNMWMYMAPFVERWYSSSPRFHNLTKLELDAHWLFFANFLEKADNLEVVILGEVDKHLRHWRDPECVPKCLLSHLRSIKIDQFGFTDREFDMVRYLLSKAKVLKKMEIYSSSEDTDVKVKFKALQKIAQFQRGSAACELDFF